MKKVPKKVLLDDDEISRIIISLHIYISSCEKAAKEVGESPTLQKDWENDALEGLRLVRRLKEII